MSPRTEIADPRSRILVGLALAALMAATRGQHFAPLGQHLPDASLAVFFLAGLYLSPVGQSVGRGIRVFLAFFGLATLIDLLAVGWGGVSAYCLSPAYVTLVPAYGTAWGAGRWYGRRHREDRSNLALLAGTLLAAGLAAELFASGGFYLFSGRFAEPSLLGFGHSLIGYLGGTLGALFAYAGLAALVHLSLLSPRAFAGRGPRIPGSIEGSEAGAQDRTHGGLRRPRAVP